MPGSAAGAHVDDDGTNNATITRNGSAPTLPELCAATYATVEAFLNAEPRTEKIRSVQQQSRKSLAVIAEALQRYGADELSLSYNGGKDCLVLLILYLHALHRHYTRDPPPKAASTTPIPPSSQMPRSLQSVYIVSPHPFKAVEEFVDATTPAYQLSLARYAKPMKEAFADYLDDYPQIRAIFVGTRRTDPHGSLLTDFDRTDRGWPDFMRVHPVIDWHYAEIWTFIRELGIPYCSLYDRGYTSLGGIKDTHPNPALRVGEGFRPAYELVDDDEERLGRDR